MPWAYFRNLTDDDLKAMFAYLKTVKPVNHVVDNSMPPTLCVICNEVHGGGRKIRSPTVFVFGAGFSEKFLVSCGRSWRNVPTAAKRFHQENCGSHAPREQAYGCPLVIQQRALRVTTVR